MNHIRSRQSLTLKTEHLTFVDSRRNRNVERFAVRYRHDLVRAFHGVEKIDLERIAHILRRHPEVPAFAAPTKEIGEDVVVKVARAHFPNREAEGLPKRPSKQFPRSFVNGCSSNLFDCFRNPRFARDID